MLTMSKMTRRPEDAADYYYAKTVNYYFDQSATSFDGLKVYGKLLPHIWLEEGEAMSRERCIYLLQGKDANGVQRTLRRRAVGGVNGMSLSFAAPKSVSLVATMGMSPFQSGYGADVRIKRDIMAAHDEAVLVTMRWMEERLAGSRTADKFRKQIYNLTGKMSWGIVRDFTNRNDEPHLDSHVLVFNLASYEKDGETHVTGLWWNPFYGECVNYLFGSVYQVELRRRIHALSIKTSPVPGGFWRIDAVPAELDDEFSSRRDEIREEMKRIDNREKAFYATRADKKDDIDVDALVANWRRRIEKYPKKPEAEIRAGSREHYKTWAKAHELENIEARQEVAVNRMEISTPQRWQLIAERATEKPAHVHERVMIWEYLRDMIRSSQFIDLPEAEARFKRALANGWIAALHFETRKTRTPYTRYSSWSLCADERLIQKTFKEQAPTEIVRKVAQMVEKFFIHPELGVMPTRGIMSTRLPHAHREENQQAEL